jgi:hypothetical protein
MNKNIKNILISMNGMGIEIPNFTTEETTIFEEFSNLIYIKNLALTDELLNKPDSGAITTILRREGKFRLNFELAVGSFEFNYSRKLSYEIKIIDNLEFVETYVANTSTLGSNVNLEAFTATTGA